MSHSHLVYILCTLAKLFHNEIKCFSGCTVSFISERQICPTINWSEADRYICIIAEPEGEATNLDAQVAECLYICINICLYVYMSVTVSYGHLARGLEIVSVAIPMASSCSIYLYNVLNSQFRLLPILRCTCGGQFSEQLRQSVSHFLPLVPSKSLWPTGMLDEMASVTWKRDLVCGEKALGSEKPFECTIAIIWWLYTSSR